MMREELQNKILKNIKKEFKIEIKDKKIFTEFNIYDAVVYLDEFLDGAETQYKKELESFFNNLGYSFEKIAVIYIELFIDKKEKKYYIDNELMSEELAYIFILYTNMNILKVTDEIKLIEK